MTGHDECTGADAYALTELHSETLPRDVDPIEYPQFARQEQNQAGNDGEVSDPDDELFRALEYVTRRQDHLLEEQQHLNDEFQILMGHFERLAQHVGPLLTNQFEDTKERIRVLERRLRNRQERPLLTRIAVLLSDVRRLEAAEDIRAHVEEALIDTLNSLGYQEIGLEGDHFDPLIHEPVAGATGRIGVVRHVYSRGLTCYGDVLIKAKVDVEPIVEAHDGVDGKPTP